MPVLETQPNPFPPGFNPTLVAGPFAGAGNIGVGGQIVANLGPVAQETDGYEEHFRADGEQSVKRVFEVLWGPRWLWRDQMLGFTVNNPLLIDPANPLSGFRTDRGSLSRTPPDNIPEMGGTHLYCSDLHMAKGQGIWLNNPNVFVKNGDGTLPNQNTLHTLGLDFDEAPGPAGVPVARVPMIAYFDPISGQDGLALYEATYTPRPYEIRSDAGLAAMGPQAKGELERYVERNPGKYALQAIPLPNGQLTFQFGPNKGQLVSPNAQNLFTHVQALEYVWHEVPDYPFGAIASCINKVNSVDFDGAQGAVIYKAGSVLCQGPLNVMRYRTVQGRIYWRITYGFLVRAVTPDPSQLTGLNALPPGTTFLGWNSLPDQNGLYWPVAFPAGNSIYQTADLNTLFVPPAPITYQGPALPQ